MTLVQARQIWVALLTANAPCASRDWQRWADRQFLIDVGAHGEWLFRLSMAKSRKEALAVSSAIHGFDWWNTDPQELQVLTVGFVASRYFDGEISFHEMLKFLLPLACDDPDPNQLEGSWCFWPSVARSTMPYLTDRLGPIAAYACAMAGLLLQSEE